MDTVRLRVDAGETVVSLEPSAAPVATLPIGWHRPGGQPFRATPPDALDLEQAIEGIENAVMPLARRLPAGARLVTDDALAGRLPGRSGDVLGRDAVEAAFNLVADVASGRPALHAGELADPALAGYLVILREVLHHLGFDAIALEPAAD